MTATASTAGTPSTPAATIGDAVIRSDNLRKDFGGNQVLRGVDLAIPPGTVLGLLGRNGSGKTTLIKCALGLLRPTSGRATIFDDNAWDLSAKSKARLGYVPQEVVSYPWMRVRQVIAYTAAFYPTWNSQLVDLLCRRWQLPLEERVGVLSVGQLQALGIVIAMGHEPELLVLDEPVASLDPSARRQFLKVLLEILDDHGGLAAGPARTILFSTHITSDLERVANQVAILRDGQIGFHGELGDLKDRVKRLRITAREHLPASFAVPGALRTEVEGPVASVSVDQFSDQLVETLRTTWNADVTVQDLNLEEIFVEIHHA